MPRMPMIEAAAKTLLLLAFLLAATMSSARSAPTNEVIDNNETTTQQTTTEEYSTFSAILDMSTEGVPVDANGMVTTEKDQETFTSLPELGLTASGQPLEFVVPGEEAESEDSEWQELSRTMTTTESPNQSEPLVDTTTITSPEITTTMLPITETTTLPGQSSLDSIPNVNESRMEEMITESLAEETTLTADESEPIQASQKPLKQELSPTTGPVPLEATASITESNQVEMAESTTEADAISPMTTQQPEPEQQEKKLTEADKSGTTESTVQHMLSHLVMPAVTEMASIEPVTELITTEVPTVQPELTTIGSAQEIATTVAEAETTNEPPKAVVSLADAVETPATTEAAQSTTDSAGSTNIISTTEPIVVPTTEQKPKATRAPRIERIFNSDGVEVLYGYSNVVRTNHA